MRLIVKLLAGITGGMLIGLYAPEFFSRVFVTFKIIFGQFIGFIIPLIIVFFIASGISELGKQSGKMLGLTSGLAYSSTLLAGILAYVVAVTVVPLLTGPAGEHGEEGAGLEPLFELTIEPIVGVMTALITAFVFGIGMTRVESPVLKQFFDQGKNIVELLIKRVIIPLLPLYIAGVFVDLAAEGSIFPTLRAFGIVLLLAVLTHWVWLLILYTVSGTLTGRNPFRALKTMLPAYFTAIGTMSSAATIPVTLRQAKENKIKEHVADFAIPLSATIHLSGSTITLVLCSVAVMVLSSGLELPTLGTMLPFIMMLGVIMIAAPGVPGGAVMAALGLLSTMLGFDEAALGLMIALYMAQDSFGTACNVTGDGALALVVDKYSQ
ncbi:sodium:glutamate symporter [Caldalkalibacillus thermarum]|uniref:dicarboxylate/amino acid:cation symporter n=1 Tax=Caldalkalibacillus thermarum TaxID=296745 RepID=UPI001665367D|nr:dicarboxylate/amino acid:cation symporter [Caldalkalibacillus thermarum]GGK29388.1 sodium:glutamate symporter [Caldalkalibacillus thermarum]